MPNVVIMYISAAGDLNIERDALSRAITEIPTTLAWKIILTPLIAQEPDLQALSEAHIHILLLGSDVRAPVGVEWASGRRSGRLPRLYLKENTIRTQSAQAFERELSRFTNWLPYVSLADVKHKLLLHVSEYLLFKRDYFELTSEELDRLSVWRRSIRTENPKSIDQTIGGAGNSSIILSAERFMPSDGV